MTGSPKGTGTARRRPRARAVPDLTAPWVDAAYAAMIWPDAANLDPATLTELLAVAQAQLVDYVPALPDDAAEIPDRWRMASVYQARDIWTAAQRTEADLLGVGEYAIRPRPLGATVKALARPWRAGSRVG